MDKQDEPVTWEMFKVTKTDAVNNAPPKELIGPTDGTLLLGGESNLMSMYIDFTCLKNL